MLSLVPLASLVGTELRPFQWLAIVRVLHWVSFLPLCLCLPATKRSVRAETGLSSNHDSGQHWELSTDAFDGVMVKNLKRR